MHTSSAPVCGAAFFLISPRSPARVRDDRSQAPGRRFPGSVGRNHQVFRHEATPADPAPTCPRKNPRAFRPCASASASRTGASRNAGCECPWVRNQGGGVGRRPTPEDIRAQGHSCPAPDQSHGTSLTRKMSRTSPDHSREPTQGPRPGAPATTRSQSTHSLWLCQVPLFS